MSSGVPWRSLPLAGWGNYLQARCPTFRPERRRELLQVLARGGFRTYVCRGMGRSYGDQALNPDGAVILMTRLNRFLGLDEAAGIIDCEAGVTVADLVRHLLPRGLALPVTPGTQHVTVGGAIASDVHGKNHHRVGSFAQAVVDLDLLAPDGRLLRCSPQQHPELFWATLGGLGLTGAIVRARLRLRRLETAWLAASYRRLPDLDAALAALADAEARHEYSVCWIDCMARGAALGRGLLLNADHAPRSLLRGPAAEAPLRLVPRRAAAVPTWLPRLLPRRVVAPAAVAAFNACYYRRHPTGERLVDYASYFYPLDAVGGWNRLYGRAGFVQCQAVFPHRQGGEGVRAVLGALHAAGAACTLGVLKRMGPESGGLLSFPCPGVTLAVDVAAFPRLAACMDAVHDAVLRHGGRVYLTKDATLRAEAVRAMYPRLAEFEAVKARVDAHGVFASAMARRLGLAAPGDAG